MKARYWSLAIVLLLINYLIFAALFTHLVEGDFSAGYATRTPIPTFTPAPAQPIIIVPTSTPVPVVPSPTATRVVQASANSGAPAAESRAEDSLPESAASTATDAYLVAPGAVNIRSGPGVNYSVIGALNADIPMPIVGRNAEASWWQIKITGDTRGWVANSVVEAHNAAEVIVVEAPPPPASASVAPQPAADNSQPAAEQPKYQYEPTGWYDDGNAGLTRFMGDIVDANGSPVNGVFIQAKCGDFSTISFPSGPVGWGGLNESTDWPAGFYDIVVDDKPVPCVWTLTVVDAEDRKTIKAVLSESVPVQISNEKSIVTANWRKNW